MCAMTAPVLTFAAADGSSGRVLVKQTAAQVVPVRFAGAADMRADRAAAKAAAGLAVAAGVELYPVDILHALTQVGAASGAVELADLAKALELCGVPVRLGKPPRRFASSAVLVADDTGKIALKTPVDYDDGEVIFPRRSGARAWWPSKLLGARRDEKKPTAKLRRPRFDGRFALRDVGLPEARLMIDRLVIEDGQAVAITGTVGSGKSTLIRILAGVEAPERGQVLLDGVPLSLLDKHDLNRGVALVPDAVCNPDLTLRTALLDGMPLMPEARLYRALRFAGMEHTFAKLDTSCQNFSRGEAVQLGFARLWLRDPQVVLLDEPLDGLDGQVRALLLARLAQWLQGRTALIATHAPDLAALCGRMIVLDRGGVVIDGPQQMVAAQMRTETARQG